MLGYPLGGESEPIRTKTYLAGVPNDDYLVLFIAWGVQNFQIDSLDQ